MLMLLLVLLLMLMLMLMVLVMAMAAADADGDDDGDGDQLLSADFDDAVNISELGLHNQLSLSAFPLPTTSWGPE